MGNTKTRHKVNKHAGVIGITKHCTQLSDPSLRIYMNYSVSGVSGYGQEDVGSTPSKSRHLIPKPPGHTLCRLKVYRRILETNSTKQNPP
jgi:hypothetical protein